MNESYIFYTDKLNGEYRDAFNYVELYINTKCFDDVATEEYLSELLDIFLTAQSKGKPVQKITGSSIEHFCETFCSGYGIKNRVLDFLDRVRGIVWGLFVFSLVDMLFLIWDYADGIKVDFWQSSNNINIPVYLIGILIAVLFGYISNLITRNIMFHTKHISMTVLQFINLFVIVAVMILTFIIMNNVDNMWNILDWIVMLTSVLYLIPYYLFNYKRLKEKKGRKIGFNNVVAQASHSEFQNEMEKKFLKENRKNIKKGKAELTMEEFLKKEEKECKKAENLRLFYLLLPIVITAAAFAGTYVSGGFETLLDVLIFPAIMLIIEYAILIVIWKIVKIGIVQRKLWIDEKRKELNSDTE